MPDDQKSIRVLEDGTVKLICPGCEKPLAYLDPSEYTEPLTIRLRCDRVRTPGCRVTIQATVSLAPDGGVVVRCDTVDIEEADDSATMTDDERDALILAEGFDALLGVDDVGVMRSILVGMTAERDKALDLARKVLRSNRSLGLQLEVMREKRDAARTESEDLRRQRDHLLADRDRFQIVTSEEVRDVLASVDASIDAVNEARERMERHQIDYLASLSKLYGPVRLLMFRLGYKPSRSVFETPAMKVADVDLSPESEKVAAAENMLGQGHEQCCPPGTARGITHVYNLTINAAGSVDDVVRDFEQMRAMHGDGQNTAENAAPEHR